MILSEDCSPPSPARFIDVHCLFLASILGVMALGCGGQTQSSSFSITDISALGLQGIDMKIVQEHISCPKPRRRPLAGVRSSG